MRLLTVISPAGGLIKQEHVDSWLLCHLSSSEILTENVFLTHQCNRLYWMQIYHYHIALDVNAELVSFWLLCGRFSPRFEEPTSERVEVRQIFRL